MTEISTLERKPLSDLHQIASQLGIKEYRKYRKPQLAELIYKTATEQAAGQRPTPNGGEAAPQYGTTANGETANGATQGRVTDSFGEADTALAPTPGPDQRQEPQRRDRRAERQGERPEKDGRQQDGQGQSGILDVLPDGFGFLRTNGYSQGKGDVYVSTSQIKRFNLRRGDYIVGQIRQAREGEKYPALVRIESVNG